MQRRSMQRRGGERDRRNEADDKVENNFGDKGPCTIALSFGREALR